MNIDIIAPTKLAAAVFEYNPYVRKIFINPVITDVLAIADTYDLAIDISDSKMAGKYMAFINAQQINYHNDP